MIYGLLASGVRRPGTKESKDTPTGLARPNLHNIGVNTKTMFS